MSLMHVGLFEIIFTSQPPQTPPPAAQRQFRLAIPPAALKESSVWGDQRAGLVPSELNTKAGTFELLPI